MKELLAFRKWAEDIGHWQIVAGVDRYLAMLETEEYKERKVPAVPIDKKARLDQLLKERDEFLAEDELQKEKYRKYEAIFQRIDLELQKICLPINLRN